MLVVTATSDTVPTLLFVELLGLFMAYAATLGEVPPSPWRVLRIFVRIAFLACGCGLIFVSLVELNRDAAELTTGLLVLVIAAGALSLWRFVQWRRFRGWQSWPLAQGHVEESTSREVRTRNSHYWVVEVAYSYEISGQFYSGRFTRDFFHERDASEFETQMRGRNVLIRYNPQAVERSRLDSASNDLDAQLL